MPKKRLSVSVDAKLAEAARAAVTGGRAESVSAWVESALRLRLDHDAKLKALDEFIRSYEAKHGEITQEEMDEAKRRLRSRAVVVRGRPVTRRKPSRGRSAT
jgi:Arc/MetJ-type ribon-helix-helix transcriptional regulator